MRKAYGTAGDTKYWRTLQQVIFEDHKDFNPSGLEDYNKKEEKAYNTKTFEYVREIETFFKEDFKEKLIDEFGSGWLKKGVPPTTLKKSA